MPDRMWYALNARSYAILQCNAGLVNFYSVNSSPVTPTKDAWTSSKRSLRPAQKQLADKTSASCLFLMEDHILLHKSHLIFIKQCVDLYKESYKLRTCHELTEKWFSVIRITVNNVLEFRPVTKIKDWR